MTTKDAVLAVFDAVPQDDRLSGRTRLQKTVYLAASMVGVALPFRAHYYGPFSAQLAAEVDSLVDSGVLDETARSITASATEGRRLYEYRLPEEGRGVVEAARQRCTEWDAIVDAARRVVVGGYHYDELSWAAKVHWILIDSGRPIALETARAKALELNWILTSEDVVRAVEILVELGLAEQRDD